MLLKQLNESLLNHNFAFIVYDPQTGEFMEHARGSMLEIIKKLQADPENSMLADVIKQHTVDSMDKSDKGLLSFPYDDHQFLFVPL